MLRRKIKHKRKIGIVYGESIERRGCNFRVFREGLEPRSKGEQERAMWKFGGKCSRQRELHAEGLSDICIVVGLGNNMEGRVAENNEQEEGNRR